MTPRDVAASTVAVEIGSEPALAFIKRARLPVARRAARFATPRRTVTEADIVAFAGLTADFNPLHVDEEFSKKSIFGGRILHGPFTSAGSRDHFICTQDFSFSRQ